MVMMEIHTLASLDCMPSPGPSRSLRPARSIEVVAGRAGMLYGFVRMKTAKARPAWLTPAVRRHLKRVEYDFHVRAFGEEMARVNFLPLAQRRRYVAEMVDHAGRKGVKFDKPALGITP